MEKFNSQSVEALGLLKLTMVAAGNSRSSITAYLREIRYLCAYFPDLSPDQWSDRHIIQYMAYLRTVHHASYSKCKMTAQSVAFFFRHVLKRPYDVPSKLYPKREYKLPHYLTKDEVLNKNPNVICLKVKYFHVVFTLPHELNALVMGNRVKLFNQNCTKSNGLYMPNRPWAACRR